MPQRIWRFGEAEFRPLYPDDMGLREKTQTIAREIYGAGRHRRRGAGRAKFGELERRLGPPADLRRQDPISFSDDPSLIGAPTGHVPKIRDVRLRAGAGFVVVLMGDIRTMPGLPRSPAAERIRVVNGAIQGLF